MTKRMAAAWLIAFAVLLLTPLAVYPAVKSKLNSENTENRVLAARPALNMASAGEFRESLKAFPAAFDSYFNDHLPYRSQMIEANGIFSINVLGDSPSDSVVLGEDDWLFYSDGTTIEDFKGTNLYSDEQLAQIRDNLLSAKQYLEERGIEFVLMIPQDKETVYSEHLPSYITKRNDRTRADALVSYLRETTDLRIVYPKEEMAQYKDQYDLYWHYDTHWNNLGGYIGGRALLTELGVWVPPVEEMNIAQTMQSNYDLAGMMNLTSYYMANRPPDVNYDVWGYAPNNMQVIKVDDPTELIYTSDAPDRRRLFLVRDSFAGGMANVLACNFAYTYMPHWNGCFNQAQIEEQAPDIFVYELVERRLDKLLEFRLPE